MKYCPITLDQISNQQSYSSKGLKKLSAILKELKPLELTANEQREEALMRVGKMSIQGIQSKLSARLKISEGRFEIVDRYGNYILKPQSQHYVQLPENEALTMSLAETFGLDVPVHGLVYGKDQSMTYFIKRFDRGSHHNKLATEDFAQLSQRTRDTKYNSTMEQVAKIIMQYCSFPKIELIKLFKLTLFNFLIGNEDMHLKNFSLITRRKHISLSPVYDLLNTSIAMKNPQEEMALPLRKKKHKITRNDLIEYYAEEKLQLNKKIIADVLGQVQILLPTWKKMISHSFLSQEMKNNYLHILQKHCNQINLG